jgi:hypothetical protein
MLITQAAVPRSEMRAVVRVPTARGCRRCASECGVDAWAYRRIRDAGTRSCCISYNQFYAEFHPLSLEDAAGAIALTCWPAYMIWRVTSGSGQRSAALGIRLICVEAIECDSHRAGLHKLGKGCVLDNWGHNQDGQCFHLQHGRDRRLDHPHPRYRHRA